MTYDVTAVREAVVKSDPVALGPSLIKLPEDPSAEYVWLFLNPDDSLLTNHSSLGV
jgi:hypothetical protein